MPTGPKHPKRPRDLNQWAKRMTDIVSGEVEGKTEGNATRKADEKKRRQPESDVRFWH
jgi:hypothetical protein